MIVKSVRFWSGPVILPPVLSFSPASADAIEGRKIMIPGGKRIAGNYDRHGSICKVPPGDEDAGSMNYISQTNEESMELCKGPGQATPEIRLRCAAPVSYENSGFTTKVHFALGQAAICDLA